MEIKEILHSMEENFTQYYHLLEPIKSTGDLLKRIHNVEKLKEFLETLTKIEDEVIDFRLKKIQREEHPYIPSINVEKINHIVHVGSYSLNLLIEQFLNQRKDLINFLYSTPTERWERTGVHEKEGHVSFKEFVKRMIQRDRDIIVYLSHFVPASSAN